MKARKLLIQLAALLVCVAVGATMMVIGRGHTVYFDNKTLEYNGKEYPAFYRVELSATGMDKPTRLEARDRGVTKCTGQSLHIDLTVTATKGSTPQELSWDVALPYGMDNPILNLPALLAELPQEAWLDEFIPTPSAVEEPVEDLPVGDDVGLGTEGLDG